jgi:hypothetical protein
MNLEKLTKKQLIENVNEKSRIIEGLNSNIEKSCRDYQSLQNDYIRSIEEYDELNQQLRLSHLENISDIKSIQKLLVIYENESMTHREKAYLGGKISRVISNIVDEKIKSLDFSTLKDNNLPF